jgi:hypothetical protein
MKSTECTCHHHRLHPIFTHARRRRRLCLRCYVPFEISTGGDREDEITVGRGGFKSFVPLYVLDQKKGGGMEIVVNHRLLLSSSPSTTRPSFFQCHLRTLSLHNIDTSKKYSPDPSLSPIFFFTPSSLLPYNVSHPLSLTSYTHR